MRCKHCLPLLEESFGHVTSPNKMDGWMDTWIDGWRHGRMDNSGFRGPVQMCERRERKQESKQAKGGVGGELVSRLVMLTRVHNLRITSWPRSIPRGGRGGSSGEREREKKNQKGEVRT